ncbi:cytochrome c oxidase subunit II [Prolixibacteraceae bacterium JC049]|nr:cytochrome c oxidase subunit II [Prolixibacteraceae bacterium JC049]
MINREMIDASNLVAGVDKAFWIILSISFLFLIGLTIVMLYFVYKYNKKRHPKAVQIDGSVKLEIIWTGIPLILVMLMFYYGWKGYKPVTGPAPDGAMEITAVARMWNFQFQYENGKRTDTLYIPKDRPVKLNLKALDVIHGLSIPAFRVKSDMVPGRKDHSTWFIPQKEGKFDLFCTEYCGLNHSYMYTAAVVMPQEKFDKWYKDKSAAPVADKAAKPGAQGLALLQKTGCVACHSFNGTKLIGPTFKGIYGAKHVVKRGKEEVEITVDDEYIRKSIMDPNAEIVKGYKKGLMLSYKEQLTDKDVDLIIEYLKTLK